MDLVVTLLALIVGTLGSLGAMLLLRVLAESDRAAQHDRKGNGRRSAHSHTDDTLLNSAAR